MKQILKGLFMTLVTFVATLWETSGFPKTNLAWQVMGLTITGTVVIYLAQSLMLPSTSKEGEFNLMDFIKGAIIVAGNGLIALGVSNFTGTTLDINVVFAAMGTVLLPYMTKQFITKPSGIPPTK